jgi:hypothetical protein
MTTPKDTAYWLFEFAKIDDLSKVTRKRFAALAASLAAVGKKEAGDILPGTDPFEKFLTLDDRGQLATMGAFQGWLKDQFKQAEAGKGWLIDPNLEPFRTIDLFKTRARDASLPGDTFAVGLVDCFKIAANRIVKREHDRFGSCQSPRCGKPFVAQRKNRGKYCSIRCANYVNTLRSRGKL